MESISRLSPWRMFIIAVVLAATAAVIYAVVGALKGTEDVALAEGEQVVKVRRGDFLKQVSISGSLAFPNAHSLFFSTQGTVGQVFVRQGEWVEEGQTLASLDGVAVITLQKGLAQAQRDLKAAQAALDEALVSNDEAKVAYRQVFKKWLGITLTDEEAAMSPAALLASWDADLNVLFDPTRRFTDLGWFAGGPPANDPATPWNETVIYTWMNLTPGSIRGTCPANLELPDAHLCVQREFNDAWEELGGSESDPLEIIMLEADLVLAEAAFEEASRRVEGATLVAPISGIITQMSVTVGTKTDTGNAAIKIVDPSVIELVGIVDQTDILSVRQGETALVNLDALPGRALEGVVSSVAASADNQQGYVGYAVRVRVPAPDGMVFPEGLTGTARVVLAQQSDVLMVPVNAVRGGFANPLVRVVVGGSIVERSVVLGDSDDFWTVVLEGLRDGDDVVTQGQAPNDGGFPGGPGFPTFPVDPGVRPIPAPGGGASEPGVIIIEERPLPAPGGSGSGFVIEDSTSNP